MRIGVISDTHGMVRPEALEALAGSELILHAGDVGPRRVLEVLEDLAPVWAVRGNMDKPDQAGPLPWTQAVQAAEAMLYVLHDLSQIDLDPNAAGFQAVIYGHSHKPSMEWKDGVLYLNPGSAGPRRFSLPVTLACLEVVGGGLKAELIDLFSIKA